MDNQISVLEEVQKIYSDVSEWLKFLEAKHAGLFAAWTAVLIAVFTLDGFIEWPMFEKAIVIIPILIGCGINLFSFTPFLNRCKLLKSRCYKKYYKYAGNPVFYQSIFVSTYNDENDMKISIGKYKKILENTFDNTLDDSLLTDYLKQVIEVSAVGTIKAYLFSIAAGYTFGLIILGIVMLVIA